MSKRKWYTRALYTTVALAMTVGLVIVPAAAAPVVPEVEPPAVKATLPANAEISSICFVDGSGGTGDIYWSDAYASAGSSYSVMMDGGTQTGAQYVSVEWTLDGTMTLADLTEFEYTYYFPAAGTYGPHVCFYCHDPDDLETADINGPEPSTLPVPANLGWNTMTIVPSTPDFYWFGSETTDGGIAQGTGTLNTLATFQTTADFSSHVIDRIAIEFGWWAGGTTGTAYLDTVSLNETDIGLEVSLCPDIAYNVKTAEEEYRLYGFGDCDTGIPMCDTSADDKDWRVFKGCGAGDVEIVAGGELDTPNNYIVVNLVTKGDCHITVDFEDDTSISLDAEKKWGEIYCTELVSEKVDDGIYDVTETVTASFLWEDCITELELVADDAVVDWWLMGIDALAAVEALEAALGDDPCDVDGGCGTYEPGFFEYDVDDDGTAEVYGSPGEALLAIYAEFDNLPGGNAITPDSDSNDTHEQTESDVDGETTVEVTLTAPTSAILVTLTDYPIDKHGQNTVCVQHETWVVVPPPTIEKLPNILWAGEKDVIEWRLPEDAIGLYVIFYLEDPSVGTFEGTDPWFPPPYPSGITAIKDTAITTVVYNDCDECVARVILHSDKQGKANVVAALLSEPMATNAGQSSPKEITRDGIISQQGFLVFFLAFEEVELVNLDEDVDNDEAWEEAGETTSDLAVDDESLLRLRVKGYFEDPVMKSTRSQSLQDIDGDGNPDIILPAGRWVLPDDYPILADGLLWQLNKPHWDIMDTPIDEIVSMLDADGDEVETLGPYGDGACFESPLYDTTLTTTALQLAAYLEGLVSCYPVVGPFSKLQPPTETGWEMCDVTWDGTDLLFSPAVPGDLNQVDDLEDADGVDIIADCRTTVVPDGLLTPEDAVMPPAEILFVVTDGDGELTAVDKADLYYRDEDCTFGALSVDGEVYTNPYYWQEIPANSMIPPMYGSGPAGYEWDSWDADVTIDGPYGFWDSLSVWASDLVFARTLAGLGATETPEVLKVYTDNRGEAWAEFEQKDFDSSTIEAVASYPYLIGDHPAVLSNPVIKESANLKDIVLYVDALDPVDPIRRMLYVFVRDYDGTPASCEKVEWLIDGPWGVLESLLEGTDEACTNACYPVDYWDCEDADIATDGRSAVSCTREWLDDAERDEFVDEAVFASAAVADDYAIAGIKVLSSHLEDVNVSIKIHDCWDDTVIIMTEDQMVEFGDGDDVVEWDLAYGQDVDPAAVNIWTYPAGAATVTLLDVDATMPDGLLIWHYSLADGWTFYKKGWGASNTLTTMVPGGYIGIVPTDSTWEIPQS